MSAMEHLDPYWHLHDEEFEAPFMRPLLNVDDAVFMGGRKVQCLKWGVQFHCVLKNSLYLASRSSLTYYVDASS